MRNEARAPKIIAGKPERQVEPGRGDISNRRGQVRRPDGTLGPVHNAYLAQRGALSPEAAEAEAELAATLDGPEGIVGALKQRAVRSLTICAVLEAYVEKEVAAGVPLDELPILLKWPYFSGAAVRALTALSAALPKGTSVAKTVTDILTAHTTHQDAPGQAPEDDDAWI